MADFSPRSLANLQGVHPALVALFKDITAHFDCSILPGSVRTPEQQQLNVAKGLSQTLDSNHIVQADGFSHAVDVGVNPQQWDNSPASGFTKYQVEETYFAGFVMGFAAARPELLAGFVLRWGGNWRMDWLTQNNSFNDLDHFELHEVPK